VSLTTEQRARVACEVTCLAYEMPKFLPELGQIICQDYTDIKDHIWQPEYQPQQWKRLVEWLADRIKKLETEDKVIYAALVFIEAVTERDISKLEQLVHTLLEQKHG
jgi:uncharacterized Zn finger protein